MSETADPVRTLHGWLELVDCSVLFNPNAVTQDLLEIVEQDPAWECDGVLWNEDNTSIISMELLRWDEPAPSDMASFFEPLTHHLLSGEYLVFEGKLRFGHLTNTLMVLLVSTRGVFIADGKGLAAEIKKLSGVDDPLPTAEEEESLL